MVDIREYLDSEDHSPFREWLDKLSSEAAQKVTKTLYRLGLRNFSNVQSVGAGVFGGRKQRQQNDIRRAPNRWGNYKNRKKHQKEEE